MLLSVTTTLSPNIFWFAPIFLTSLCLIYNKKKWVNHRDHTIITLLSTTATATTAVTTAALATATVTTAAFETAAIATAALATAVVTTAAATVCGLCFALVASGATDNQGKLQR